MSAAVSQTRITGAAAVAGIVGNPVAHSLSPVIHNAWLEAAGMDGAYVAFAPKDAAGFDALVAAGRAGLIQGVNVTAPFKEQAFALADVASSAARLTGSANILAFHDGEVRADSSDGVGLMLGLAEQAPGLEVRDRIVVMLGAGGAARAGAGALLEAGARLRIVNRSRERAEVLAADLIAATGGEAVVVDAGGVKDALSEAALVINALTIQPEINFDALSPDAVLMDMTYKPLVTPFLAEGRRRGHVTVDGLSMLIGQAAPSFEALFRRAPPSLDLRDLVLAHLARQQEAAQQQDAAAR